MSVSALFADLLGYPKPLRSHFVRLRVFTKTLKMSHPFYKNSDQLVIRPWSILSFKCNHIPLSHAISIDFNIPNYSTKKRRPCPSLQSSICYMVNLFYSCAFLFSVFIPKLFLYSSIRRILSGFSSFWTKARSESISSFLIILSFVIH